MVESRRLRFSLRLACASLTFFAILIGALRYHADIYLAKLSKEASAISLLDKNFHVRVIRDKTGLAVLNPFLHENNRGEVVELAVFALGPEPLDGVNQKFDSVENTELRKAFVSFTEANALPGLKSLCVAGNWFGDYEAKQLSSRFSLTRVCISGTMATDKGLKEILVMPGLEVLRLEHYPGRVCFPERSVPQAPTVGILRSPLANMNGAFLEGVRETSTLRKIELFGGSISQSAILWCARENSNVTLVYENALPD